MSFPNPGIKEKGPKTILEGFESEFGFGQGCSLGSLIGKGQVELGRVETFAISRTWYIPKVRFLGNSDPLIWLILPDFWKSTLGTV